MKKRTPKLEVASIVDLHPTQITVGMREVARKRDLWRRGGATSLDSQQGPVLPIVRGPFGRPYLIDRHHLARALVEEGVAHVFTTPVADFGTLGGDDFWRACKKRGWCHPHDGEGRHRLFTSIPTLIFDLTDDPFRSLAGALRRAGGFNKQDVPFSEFAWADFLRTRISGAHLTTDFGAAVEEARLLALSEEARGLPGWKPHQPGVAHFARHRSAQYATA